MIGQIQMTTKLPLLMPVVFKAFVFLIGEGDREERKKERNL